jgi:hypothetical protein
VSGWTTSPPKCAVREDAARDREAVALLDDRVDELRGEVAASEAHQQTRNLDVARVVARPEQAVFTVEVGGEASGTAFAVSRAEGGGTWLATNFYVIDRPRTVRVVRAGRSWPGEDVGGWAKHEVALIRVRAELAGDLGLAGAGGEQLGCAQPASLKPLTSLLCRRAASDRGHGPMLVQQDRAAQLARCTTSPEPGHRGALALDGRAAGWMPAKGLGRMHARKARDKTRAPSIRIRPDRAASW